MEKLRIGKSWSVLGHLTADLECVLACTDLDSIGSALSGPVFNARKGEM